MTPIPVDTRKKLHASSLTLLRMTAGVIMTTHGAQKLMDIGGTQQGFANMGIPAPQISAYLACAGELLGGLGLIAGLLTPIAAFGVLAVMIGAIGFVHWPNGLLAQRGGFEYPLMLAAIALFFMARGAGPYSLDAVIAKKRRTEAPRHWAPGQHPLQTMS